MENIITTMSLEIDSLSEFENIFSESEIWEQVFFKVNQKFIQAVDFDDLSSRWVQLKLADPDFKILKVENCSDFEDVSDRFFELKIGSANKLFVLVLEFPEKLEGPSDEELRNFIAVFDDDRPVILQINSRNSRDAFVKNYMETTFESMSIDGTSPLLDRCLKEILALYGRYLGDILTLELCKIPDTSEMYDRIARNVLCLRVINLVEGGCSRIVPYLTGGWVLELNDVQTYLAYNDYPFDPMATEFPEWIYSNPKYLEIFIAQDNPFPKNFFVNQTKFTEKARLLLDQRKQLHESIAEGNVAEVSRILLELEENSRLKHVFNQNNDSAFATALKHFNAPVYVWLLRKNLQFCGKCVQLMKDLPETARRIITEKNQEFSVPLKIEPGHHQLLSKTFLATGHFNIQILAEKIDKFFWKLEEYPEVLQLFKIVKTYRGLKIIFDFNHCHVGMMIPHASRHFTSIGLQSGRFTYISGKRCDLKVMGTFSHEMTHLVMHILYKNQYKPFRLKDEKRKEEFDEVIEECRLVYENKVNVKTKVINQTLKIHPQEEYACELIARVPQIIVECSTDVLENIKTVYPKLFAYYFKYIPSDIKKACNE